MAKKKTAKSPKSKASSGNETVVTQSAIVVPLDAATQKLAEACLKNSGKVTFKFKEVQVTKLPSTIASVLAVVD